MTNPSELLIEASSGPVEITCSSAVAAQRLSRRLRKARGKQKGAFLEISISIRENIVTLRRNKPWNRDGILSITPL